MRTQLVWTTLVALSCSSACTTNTQSTDASGATTSTASTATSGGESAIGASGSTTVASADDRPVATAAVGPQTVRPEAMQASTMGGDQEHPVLRCGPRDSYYFVATEFRCADGTNPLNGNVAAGRDARVGNVGANSSGHIIDLYEVPCSAGPQRVYVDMYGCPPGVNPLTGAP
jgi:hypothetical protein